MFLEHVFKDRHAKPFIMIITYIFQCYVKYRLICANMVAIGLLKFCLPQIASIHLIKLLLSPIFDVLFAF